MAIGVLADVARAFNEVPHTSIPSNEPYGVGEGHAAASGERKEAKRAFLAGEGAWPAITRYPLLDTPSLDASERQYWQQLNAITDYVEQTGDETTEAAVIYEKVAAKLAEVYRHKEVLRLLGHVAASEGARDEEFRETAAVRAEESRGRAASMSGEIFGEPETELFEMMLAADIQLALAYWGSEDAAKDQIAREYLGCLGFESREEAEQKLATMPQGEPYEELRDDTMQIIREDFCEIFPDFEEAMRPYTGLDHSVKPADAQPAFQAALRAMGVDWPVRILTGKKVAAEASEARSEITIGELRNDFTSDEMLTKPLHEGWHARLFQNAKMQEQPHLQSSLPRTLDFGEGLPVVLEQIFSGKKRVPGVKYYLQIGLLKGLHDIGMGKEQSFHAVNEIMWRRAALQEKGPIDRAKLQGASYSSVMRTARGNARDNRDISYFVGARKATQFLNETAALPKEVRQARLRWLMSTTFDPTNPEHVELVGGDPAAAYLEAA